MRSLTLDEKISIKGCLAGREPAKRLVCLDIPTALFVWNYNFGSSIAYHSTPKKWSRHFQGREAWSLAKAIRKAKSRAKHRSANKE